MKPWPVTLRSEQLGEGFEHEPTEDSLFSEARTDDQAVHHSWACGAVTCEVAVRVIDGIDAAQRRLLDGFARLLRSFQRMRNVTVNDKPLAIDVAPQP